MILISEQAHISLKHTASFLSEHFQGPCCQGDSMLPMAVDCCQFLPSPVLGPKLALLRTGGPWESTSVTMSKTLRWLEKARSMYDLSLPGRPHWAVLRWAAPVVLSRVRPARL